MNPQWTRSTGPSIPFRDSTACLGHEVGQDIPASQTGGNVSTPWEPQPPEAPGPDTWDISWSNPHHYPNSSSDLPPHAPEAGPSIPSYQPWQSPTSDQFSHQNCSGPMPGHSNFADTSFLGSASAQTYYPPPNCPLPFSGVSDLSDRPESSSTTTGGHSPLSDLTGQCEPQGRNIGMVSSCEQVLGAGPSLQAAQEQNPITQDLPHKREKIREKKERDKKRKRAERSNNSKVYTRICELLDIDLAPRNTLANRILDAVAALVEERRRYAKFQRRVERAEAETAVLRTSLAQRSTETDTGARLSIDVNTTLDGSDTGASEL